MVAQGIRWNRTLRNFRLGRFTDRSGAACSIQESSLASENTIWLGADAARMHLTQEQVAALLPALTHFVETGELP